MKTILRIITILLVAALVAGAFSLAVSNTSSASGTNEGGSPPAITDTDGQSFQPMARPEGGEAGVSITRGLSEVLITLSKLTGIAIVVLLIQKAFSILGNHKLPLVS